MPTIARLSRCVIRIYADDHPPPHFHIILNDGRECLVDIETLRYIAGRVSHREIAEAIDWAAEQRPFLISRWKELNL